MTTDAIAASAMRRMLMALCRWLAVAGGAVLVVLSVMTVVSVLGRYFFATPVHGDFEITEMGCAVAIALFLPYCQLVAGNVVVDFFTHAFPQHLKRLLDMLGCLLIALVAAVFAWRLALGGLDALAFNDQTMVLGIPTWWGYAVLVPCFALLSVAGLETASRAWRGQHEPVT